MGAAALQRGRRVDSTWLSSLAEQLPVDAGHLCRAGVSGHPSIYARLSHILNNILNIHPILTASLCDPSRCLQLGVLGAGTYGLVIRAQSTTDPAAGSVAIKLLPRGSFVSALQRNREKDAENWAAHVAESGGVALWGRTKRRGPAAVRASGRLAERIAACYDPLCLVL